MKRHSTLLLGILLMGGTAFLVWVWRPADNEGVQGAHDVVTNVNEAVQPLSAVRSSPQHTPASSQEVGLSTRELVARIREDPHWEWKRPIQFYGKVVDETSTAVAGATATFSWSNAQGEAHEATAVTDREGLFSLTGVQGKRLQVRVSRVGYYNSTSNRISFEYADTSESIFYQPDPKDPVVFNLKRRGNADPLVVVKKAFRIPRDGTPVFIDLTRGKESPAADSHLQVRCWTLEKDAADSNRYDWRCQVSVPGGELLESAGEFAFVAPSEGYVAMLEINMPKAMEQGWTAHVEKRLFLRSRTGIYARVNFKMIAAGDHFFRIESFLNPTGSPNLEFDPERQPVNGLFE